LGGLSCAAAMARQGFKPLVLEQHVIPGGYATTFKRPGGFIFDVSLHSTTVGEREGVHNLIPGFPEIKDVEFVPHPNLYRLILPDYDLRVPQKNVKGYIEILNKHFPEEREGIEGIIDDMRGLSKDIQKLSGGSDIDGSRFHIDFPYLAKSYGKTWGDLVDMRITDPKLKTIISALWGYYGLPPSKLSSFYYAMPTWSYLSEGGYYPKGRSQKISDAFVSFIEQRGGKVMLKTKVEEILVKDQAAYGVRTADGKVFKSRVVVSNACAHDTFGKMMKSEPYLTSYFAKMKTYSVSLSSFQVFLGLKTDLVGKLGITDSEIFCSGGYDADRDYESYRSASFDTGGFGMMIYDNLYKGYSPPGKNTITIMELQGYDFWKQYEDDYFRGSKDVYNREKKTFADILINNVEEKLMPGLRDAVEVMEIGTPLTNLRYTGNYRGAIYGWDQTLNNTGNTRVPHTTPVKNLYLAGAWSNPGHGYGGVLWGGLSCFNEIMKAWG
jgi:all-trans-retinol 13,14-reductase